MHDHVANTVKAWAKEYEEIPFFFEQDSEYGERLVAWSEDAEQIKKAFYGVLDLLPKTIDVLFKVSIGRSSEGRPLWSRFQGDIDKDVVVSVVRQNESYVFFDGMHQLCLKDPESDHYLAFDEHGIFFVYTPTGNDAEVFRSLGFECRQAKLINSVPHYQLARTSSEISEKKFADALGLTKSNSDLDKMD